MNRNEIDENLKWDLSLIYKSNEDFYLDFNKVKENISLIPSFKEKFLDNAETFLEFMKLIEDTCRKLEKMYQYTHLAVDVEPENNEIQNLYSQVLSLYDDYSQNTVFIDLTISKNPEKAKEVISSDNTKIYSKYINDILRSSSHLASDEVEDVIAKADSILNSPYETYSVFRPEFKPVNINGKEEFLNQETLSEFLKNPDENIRKQAYENLYGEYKKFGNVFASTLSGTIKRDVFYSKVHKFNSPLEASLFSDNVPKELFYKVIDMALNKYHYLLLDYVSLRKKIMNKDKLEIYDMNVPLAKEPDIKYSLNDAFDLIFEATKCFGEDYQKILEKARNERWIDYYTHTGKRQGAYSSGCYDTNPYILMSYLDDVKSIFTLIHELGHSVHSYYSSHNQPYILYDYKIFVAEVASTVNENLLMYTLLEKAKSKEEKAYLLYRQIFENIGLIYRQPFFANFENILHEKASNNEGLSNHTITSLYGDLTKEYWGSDVNVTELSNYFCYAVPHFYYNYYVYKYTVGQCVSSVIASRIYNGNTEQKEKYLNFLKSGCTKDPIELLKDAGVNPLDDIIYDEAFKNFEKLLNDFKECL